MKRVIFTIIFSLFSLTFLSASNSEIVGNETDIMDFLNEAVSMNHEYDSIISVDRSLRPRLENEFAERLSRFDGELTTALADVYLTKIFGRYGESTYRFYQYIELIAKADFGAPDPEVLEMLESAFGRISSPKPVSSKEYLIAMLALRNEVSPEKIKCLDILAQISASEFNRMWYRVYRNQIISASDVEELRGLNELIYQYAEEDARIIAEVRKLEVEKYHRYTDENETSAVMKALYDRAQHLLENAMALPEEYASLISSLKRFRSSFEREYFTVGLATSPIYPGEAVIVNMNGYNVEKYEAVLYALPEEYRYRQLYDNSEFEKMLEQATSLDRKMVRTQRPFFGISRNTIVEFKGIKLGDYVVSVSDGKTTDYLRFSSSSLFVAFRGGVRGMEAFVADAKTGLPYESAELNVFNRIFDNGSAVYYPDYSRNVQLGTGFSSVLFTPEESSDHTRYFNFSRGEDTYAPISYFHDYPERKLEKQYQYVSTLLPDRPLYGFGDSIRTKVIVYDVETERVAPGKALEFKVEDGNRKNIFTGRVETDEYGSAVIAFLPDESVRAGMLHLRVSSADEEVKIEPAYRSVRLEDYYVPAFRLELDPSEKVHAFDDIFVLTGRAESYSGIPMAGIEVKLEYGTYGYRREAIVHTDADGRFSFETDLSDFSLGRRRYHYDFSVKAVATSLSGEQVTSADHYTIGRKLSVIAEFPDIVFSDDSSDYLLSLNGPQVKAEDVQWKVSVDGKEHTGITRGINGIKLLKSGKHEILVEADYQGQQISSRKEIIVLSRNEKRLPKGVDSVLIADVVQNGNALSIYTGTSEKNLHVIIEFLDGKKIMKQQTLSLSEEARLQFFDIPEYYPDRFTVSVFTVKDGASYRETEEIRSNIRNTSLNVSVLPEQEVMISGETQRVKVKVNDAEGHPVEAQLLVSVYNSSLERMGTQKWSLEKGYEPYDGYERIHVERNLYYKSVGGPDRMMANSPVPEAMDEEMSLQSSAGEGGETVRSDFNESLYYSWNLETDPSGEASFDLKAGDLLSEFCIKVFAHTKNILSGSAQDTVKVTKNLSVSHTLPEILREGDSVSADIVVTNSSEKNVLLDLSAVCADEGVETGFENDVLEVKAGETVSARLNVAVAEDYFKGSRNPELRDTVQLLLAARSPFLSDAVRSEIEILPKYKTQFISKAYFIDEGRSVRLKDLDGTVESVELTLVSPYDLIRSASYHLMKKESPTFVALLSDFVAERVLNELKAVDEEQLAASEKHFVNMLDRFQTDGGGISWIGGMNSSRYMTELFCEQMVYLKDRGIYDYSMVPGLAEQVDAAFHFLYRRMAREKELDVRLLSLLLKGGFGKRLEEPIESYRCHVDTIVDFGTFGIHQLSDMMELSQLLGDRKVVDKAYKALSEYGVEKDGYVYYPNASRSQGSFDAEIDAHLRLLSVMDLCGKQDDVQRMMKWVLMQRSLYNWGTSLSTLKIAEFLLAEYPQLNGRAQADVDGLGRVKPDGEKSYEISRRKLAGGISVRNRGNQPLVAILHAQKDVRVDSLKVDYNDIELYLGVEDNESRVTYTYDLISPLYMQYVVFEGKSASNLRNVEERSGLVYVGGALCYREIRKDGVRYYFEEIPRGSMRIIDYFYRVVPGECIESAPTMYAE